MSHYFCYNCSSVGGVKSLPDMFRLNLRKMGQETSVFFFPERTEKYTEESVCVDRVSALLFCFVPDLTKLTVLMMRRLTQTHTGTHKHALLLDSRMEPCCHICSSLHFPAYRVQRLLHHWEVRGRRSPPPSPTAAPTAVMS